MANNDSVCLNRPDTPAVARCASCNKPICARCIVRENGLNYCSRKCADLAGQGAARVGSVLDNKRKVEKKAYARNIVIAIIVLAAVAAGIFWYMRCREESKTLLEETDNFFRKAGKKINRAAKDAKQGIEDAMPSSSTYKRDRESLVK